VSKSCRRARDQLLPLRVWVTVASAVEFATAGAHAGSIHFDTQRIERHNRDRHSVPAAALPERRA
jgi:hypothetical protein